MVFGKRLPLLQIIWHFKAMLYLFMFDTGHLRRKTMWACFRSCLRSVYQLGFLVWKTSQNSANVYYFQGPDVWLFCDQLAAWLGLDCLGELHSFVWLRARHWWRWWWGHPAAGQPALFTWWWPQEEIKFPRISFPHAPLLNIFFI